MRPFCDTRSILGSSLPAGLVWRSLPCRLLAGAAALLLLALLAATAVWLRLGERGGWVGRAAEEQVAAAATATRGGLPAGDGSGAALPELAPAAGLVPVAVPHVAPQTPPAIAAGAQRLFAVSAAAAGEASYYHGKFEGRRTASGETYHGRAMTAAHRSLPFGTRVMVTNLVNGRTVVVRINDRGPFHPRRVVDLSRAAAERLGMVRRGRVPVRLEVLEAG